MTIETRAGNEAQIRERIEGWTKALRAKDVDAVMSYYTRDVLSFDLAPPLLQTGDAVRRGWEEWFPTFRGPIGYEIRDLTLTLGDDVAFGHSLNRVSGTLKNGNRTDFRLRWTACFRKIDGNWLVVHDQVSVPIDPESGRALLNLEP